MCGVYLHYEKERGINTYNEIVTNPTLARVATKRNRNLQNESFDTQTPRALLYTAKVQQHT